MFSWSKIQMVYSNFSPMGIFYLKRYLADLVIIFKNGKVMVYQFDSNFCHGCDICLPGNCMFISRLMNRSGRKPSRGKTFLKNEPPLLLIKEYITL
jgi:Pyruvate/2-oxoacid:ferredoxin oxidoreductase delta subunit